jgi:hypothetical protein
MLVGTKTDQEQQREVQKKEAMELAKELGGSHWEVSAREGRGIHEMLLCLALLLLQRQPNAETRKSFLKGFFPCTFPMYGKILSNGGPA